MKVRLTHRRYGVHTTQAEAEIPVDFTDCNEHRDEWVIDERKLLDGLPFDFLPVRPAGILLGVADWDGGGTAHSRTVLFRRWAKYFDAYMLWLVRPDAGDGKDGT